MLSKANMPGFTLIEVIVAILIIGILAAASIPRLFDFRDEADEAVFRSVRGAFISGVNLVHAKVLASSGASGFPATITIGSVPIDLSNEGWPAVSQTESNCDSLAMHGDNMTMPERRFAQHFILSIAGISPVYAIGGGGGGGDNPCSVLELVVSSGSLQAWTTSQAGSVATFTDPAGRSFTYDDLSGEVN